MAGIAAVGHFQGPGAWVAGSILTNPSDATVLVDSGGLLKGEYLFGILAAASVNVVYDLQVRDATNTSNIFVQRRRVAAGSDDFILPSKLTIDGSQRVRCVLVGGITGEVQLSLAYNEVG